MTVFNADVVKGKWTEIKGEVQKAWGHLTNDELEKTKGDMTAIKGLLQQKYGHTKEDFDSQLTKIYTKFLDKKEHLAEDLKKNIKQ